MEPHLAQLYRLATAMVGPDDARDVTEDTVVSAWRELRKLQRADRVEAWLRSILMNRARNVLRARKRRPSVTFDPLGHGDSLTEEPFSGLHDRWGSRTPSRAYGPTNAPSWCCTTADLTLPQVAETLAIREGTAKSRLHAALQALRLHFAEEPA